MATTPYSNVVGCIMYNMVYDRPNITQAARVMSQYIANPIKAYWQEGKWILGYLKGTTSNCIEYGRLNYLLVKFMDLYYGRDLDKRRSTSGYVFYLGGSAIS